MGVRGDTAVDAVDVLRLLRGAVVALLLAAALLVAPAPPEAAAYERWGRAWAPDGVLRTGCSTHVLRYRVDPPRNDWLAEIFVRTPNGQGLFHAVRDSGFHRKRGRVPFTVCRENTQFGRHKVAMKVTWYDRTETKHVGRVRPTYFRLRRP